MVDAIEQYQDDTRSMAKDYFSIGDSESETLMKIIGACAKTQGVVMAGVGGVALAGVSSIAIPGLGAIPGWAAGALAGMIGGTTSCVIAKRSIAEVVKPILGQAGRSEQEFKSTIVAGLRETVHPLRVGADAGG